MAITADRRGAELLASLERLGATVVWGSTLNAVPPEEDSLLEVETRAMLAVDPAWLAVSTGSGLRAWLQAADGFRLRDELDRLLRRTRTAARGSKSHGALRAMQIEPEFVSQKETMDDICSWLGDRVGLADVIAAQVHGGEVIGTLDALRPRVKQVLTVAPYRWVLPVDTTPACRLIEQILSGAVDVLAETSAPSVRNLFAIADGMGARGELIRSLKTTVCIASVGPVTARAFEEVGISVDVMPTRPRTADLIRAITHWVATRGGRTPVPVDDAGGEFAVSWELIPGATAVRFGPVVVRLGRQEFAVLAALVRRPGVVIRPDELAIQAWGHRAPDDATQVRHYVARIRQKLGDQASCLQTVRNVGYRYQPRADSDA